MADRATTALARAALARRHASATLRDRRERTVEGAPGARVTLRGRSLWNFSSNGYLGLSTHPRVVAAMREEATRTGASSTASRQVGGNLAVVEELEDALARLKGKEQALVFSSGYAANVGALVALGGALDEPGAPAPIFVSDAQNHASIIDGCRLAGAEVVVYPHADARAADAVLALAATAGRRALLVTESRFSMDGDVAPLGALCAACQRTGATLVVDEAHATGIDGAGRGLVHELGLADDVDVVVGTLGKALGAHGAFAAGDNAVVRWLENAARTFIYSTGLPGPVAAAALAALHVLRDERPDLSLRDNIDALRAFLAERGLADAVLPNASGPILPVLAGSAERALALAAHLLDRGVLGVAIRSPTVAEGACRVRLSVRADHPMAALVALADGLADARQAGVLRAAR